MKWYEFIIMFLIMGLVATPFIISKIPRKNKKETHSCTCCTRDCPFKKEEDKK